LIFHGYVKWPDGIFKILNYCPHKATDSPSVSVQRVVSTYQWGAGVACDATNPTAKDSANLVNICEYNYQQLMAPDSRNIQKPIYQISDSLGCKPSENSGVHGLNRFNYGYQSKQLMAVIQISTLSNNYKLIIRDYISPQQLELEL
jgi:hypothetical protein